jgi:hypothetical protein
MKDVLLIYKINDMKNYLLIILSALSLSVFGHNKLTEVKGTDFVIGSIDNGSKMLKSKNLHLLFIDTKNGLTTRVDFKGDGYLVKVEQIKIDELNINKVIVVAKTVDLDGKSGINWLDPQQIFVLSTDGKTNKQLTEDKFFTREWIVNHQTGMIVITGNYDSNGNGKYDEADKTEILIYDLKTLELKSKTQIT